MLLKHVAQNHAESKGTIAQEIIRNRLHKAGKITDVCPQYVAVYLIIYASFAF